MNEAHSHEWGPLDKLQEEVRSWQYVNFPDCREWELVLGVAEEVGEIADCVLKSHRHIRAAEFPDTRLRDAVGDVIIYLFGICDKHHWQLSDVLNVTVREVLSRRWKNDYDSPENERQA